MSVSFLVPDIACPVLGPITQLAQMLESEFPCEIVGPDFGHGICPMYRGAYPYKVIPTPRLYRFPSFFPEMRKLQTALTGDVVIAVKAFAQTVLPAYWMKRHKGCRMVVYLDEWDGYLYERLTTAERVHRWRKHWMHPVDDVYCPWVEKLLVQADGIISSSTFLRDRFGGEVLPVGVDTRFFCPQESEKVAALKKELGLQQKKIVVFGGVVRPHKGMEVLLDAMSKLARQDVCLLVVGPETEHVRDIQKQPRYQPFVRCTGSRPKHEMPAYLDVADIMVLPQVDNPLARSQVPCKIFEAMAMGKPIIASAVSDLPMILEGCGWIVPPGDVDHLTDALHDALSHPEAAAAKGKVAREKCVRLYDQTIVSQQWIRSIGRFHGK